MTTVLELKDVVKIYGTKNGNHKTATPSHGELKAVDAMSFRIEAGEAVAFLGPNGAGKSTTIKMLCGILKPTSGSCRVMGFEAGSVEANGSIGLVFGARSQLWFYLPVAKAIAVCARIYGVPKNTIPDRLKELAHCFSIEHLLDRRVRSLSLGERMRCEIVASLMHRPKILLADEPTVGLDIVSRLNLRHVLSQWQKQEGTTLLLTSHDLADVESLCSRAIFVNHGHLVYDGPLLGLRQNQAKKVVTIAFDPTLPLNLWSHTGVQVVGQNPGEHKYALTQEAELGMALNGFVSHYGTALADLKVEDPSLEMAVVELINAHAKAGGLAKHV